MELFRQDCQGKYVSICQTQSIEYKSFPEKLYIIPQPKEIASGRVTQRHIIVDKLLPEDRIMVNAGLQEGDMVVTSGLSFLNENQTVLFSNSNDTRMQQQ